MATDKDTTQRLLHFYGKLVGDVHFLHRLDTQAMECETLLGTIRNFLQEGIGWADTSGMTHDSYEEFVRHMNFWTEKIDEVLKRSIDYIEPEPPK